VSRRTSTHSSQIRNYGQIWSDYSAMHGAGAGWISPCAERKAARRAIIACLDLSSSINIAYHDSINPVDQNRCGPDWFLLLPCAHSHFLFSSLNRLRCCSALFGRQTRSPVPIETLEKKKTRKVIFWASSTGQPHDGAGKKNPEKSNRFFFFFRCSSSAAKPWTAAGAPHVGHGDSPSSLCPRPNSFT
jgi:hypothetical protein